LTAPGRSEPHPYKRERGLAESARVEWLTSRRWSNLQLSKKRFPGKEISHSLAD
jgi:hypothetical protein